MCGRLNAKQQRIATIMFKCLSEYDEDQRGIRHPMTVSEIASVAGVSAQDVMVVADAFRGGDCSFLMPPLNEPLTETTILDISHESLMRQWVSLRDTWLRQETDAANAYRRLRDRARDWHQCRSDVLTGPDLGIAREWQSQLLHHFG